MTADRYRRVHVFGWTSGDPTVSTEDPNTLTPRAHRELDDVLALCLTGSRLDVLLLLMMRPHTCKDIAASLGIEASHLSHLLHALKEHELITGRQIGRERAYRATERASLGYEGETPFLRIRLESGAVITIRLPMPVSTQANGRVSTPASRRDP